jgi:hypothetical protein
MTTSIDKIQLVADAATKVPDVARLTSQSLPGTGVFDVLMNTNKLHLLEEYKAGRITGEEYTTVYLGMLNSVMQASVQFLLNFQQEEKIQAEIALVRQKTVTELANTDNTIPLGLGFNGDTTVEGLVALQKEKLELEKTLAASEIKKADAEQLLLRYKGTTEVAQTMDEVPSLYDISGNLLSIDTMGVNIPVAGLVKSTKDKAKAEQVLLAYKGTTEVAQTMNEVPAVHDAIGNLLPVGTLGVPYPVSGLVKDTRDKLKAEQVLLAYKGATEVAQTMDEVPALHDLSGNLLSVGTLGVPYPVNGLVKSTKDKLKAEQLLIRYKGTTEVAQTMDEVPALHDLSGNLLPVDTMGIPYPVSGLVKSAKDKTKAEQLLLRYKGTTEVAQTMDEVPSLHDLSGVLQPVGSMGVPYPVSGVIGKQKNLFEAQTNGFARDAEQKAAKILTEAWSIDAASGDAKRTASSYVDLEGVTHVGNALDDPSLGSVIAILKAGVTV